MTTTAELRERWHAAMGDLVYHQDLCNLEDGGCASPLSSLQSRCAEGQRLATAEQAAYQAWSASYRGLAGVS